MNNIPFFPSTIIESGQIKCNVIGEYDSKLYYLPLIVQTSDMTYFITQVIVVMNTIKNMSTYNLLRIDTDDAAQPHLVFPKSLTTHDVNQPHLVFPKLI